MEVFEIYPPCAALTSAVAADKARARIEMRDAFKWAYLIIIQQKNNFYSCLIFITNLNLSALDLLVKQHLFGRKRILFLII